MSSVMALARDAVAHSIWCTCETSGQLSTGDFVQCTVCKVSVCTNCMNATDSYQLKVNSGHFPEKVEVLRAASSFEVRLREVLPSTLVFSRDRLAKMPGNSVHAHHRIEHLGDRPFTLRRVTRGRRCWVAHYFLREGGVGESLGEFSLRIGEVNTLHGQDVSEIGVLGELTSFLPARVSPHQYGELFPSLVYKCFDPKGKGSWMMRMPEKKGVFQLAGSEPGESFRKELGLTENAAEAWIQGAQTKINQKHFKSAKSRGEERRWLYPSNWTEWPNVIQVKAESSAMTVDIGGRYKRVTCRQTLNQNALWIRETSPPLYLLVNPEVSRVGPDSVIVSQSLSHLDRTAILARFERFWEPSDALLKPDKKVHVEFAQSICVAQ